MASPAPNTRDWTARENAGPSGVKIIVGGCVELTNTAQEPQLAPTDERNPRTLGLMLTIVDGSGPGEDVLCWKEARYDADIEPHEYDTVDVRFENSSIARSPVVDDDEFSEHQQKRAKAQNVVSANASAPAVEKVAKVAKKVAKTVAKGAKAVGGWAKGAKETIESLAAPAKKKTANKKSPKKAGKESAKAAKKTASKKKTPSKKASARRAPKKAGKSVKARKVVRKKAAKKAKRR